MWSELEIAHVCIEIRGISINEIREGNLRILLMHVVQCPYIEALHHESVIKLL